MKTKLLFLSLLFVAAISMRAQMPVSVVTDPELTKVTTANWVKQLEEAGRQSKTFAESKELIKESIDMYSQVSTYITSAAYVQSIIDKQVSLLSEASKVEALTHANSMSELAGSTSAVIKNITIIMNKNKANIELLRNILSPALKMNDAERLNTLMELEKRTDELSKQLHRTSNQYIRVSQTVRALKGAN